MSRILHRLLVVFCLLPQTVQADSTSNKDKAAAKTPKTDAGIVESSEQEKVINRLDKPSKDAAETTPKAAAPAIGVVQAEKPAPQSSNPKTSSSPDNTKATKKVDSTKDSLKAAIGDQKARDTKTTLPKMDDKPTTEATSMATMPATTNRTVSNVPLANSSKDTAAKSTHAVVGKAPVTATYDLTFWDILMVWNSELLRCIPIVLVAYSLLCLAVHYPSIVDGIAHWYMVRVTTRQTGALAQKNIYMGRSMPTQGYGELDHGFDSGKYATFSTNQFASSNQFAL